MSGSYQSHTLSSRYNPIDGTGTIRISFGDLRRSTFQRAEYLVYEQIKNLTKDRPARTVITARLVEGKRFASTWLYELSTSTKPATAPPRVEK